jgi:Na+/melibiose symporter-like transporter
MAARARRAAQRAVSPNALSWVGSRAAGETVESTLLAMRVLYALVPSVVLGLALLIALRYTLTGARHERLRVALGRRVGAGVATR